MFCARIFIICSLMGTLSGCAVWEHLTSQRVDNPVMGPPPPRESYADNKNSFGSRLTKTTTAPTPQDAEILKVAHNAQSPDGQSTDGEASRVPALEDSHVVATVNGHPIFAAEVFERYQASLDELQTKTNPQQFYDFRLQLIKRDLPSLIDRKLLILALRSFLPKEQFEQLSGHVRDAFKDQTADLMEKHKVNSEIELDDLLKKKGSSLAAMRSTFENQSLAIQYLQSQAEMPKFGRPQLFAYYLNHQDEFRVPAKVRWQQIKVGHSDTNRQSALKRINEVQLALHQGVEFGEVARKYSTGATAMEGGIWDWMEKGGLSNKQVESALWSLPIGQTSKLMTSPKDYQIVRVLERKSEYVKPFDEVQADILKKLEDEAQERESKRVLEELHKTAHIETIFDETSLASKS